MKNLSNKTLNDVCEFIVDCLHNTAPVQDDGYPLIRTPNIGKGDLLLDDVQRVSNDTYRIWTRRATPQKNDLILAREATAGNVAIIRDGQVVCLGQRTVHLRPDSKQVDPFFLCMYLLSPRIQSKLMSGETGATSRHVNMRDIRKLAMDDLPDLARQNTITSIIESYSILINNNRRRIQLLEESARLLFREWFVYFKFPNHEKVKIVNGVPDGWKKLSLNQVWDIKYGSNLPTTKIQSIGKYPVFGADSIIGYYDKHNVEDNACLVTCRGNGSGNIRRTFGTSFITNNSFIFKSNLTHSHLPFFFAMFILENLQLKNHITGAAQPQLTLSNIGNLKILIPGKSIILQFTEIVKYLIQASDNLRIQNQKLAQTRDLLLPRLMSGAIEV